MRFTIERDGTLSNIQIFRPSGLVGLDTAAYRALVLTQRVPALPGEFPGASLTMRVNFDYQR
jgi:TonB family protein